MSPTDQYWTEFQAIPGRLQGRDEESPFVRVKAIRKSVAKTSREFSRRFGIPVRTLEGWEQGRRQPDPAASVLLRVIERNPKAVEDVVREG